MKTAKFFCVLVCVFFLGAGLAGAVDSATKDECMAKVKQGALLVEQQGVDAALAKFNDKTGEFVWKDTYVFALDSETAAVIAHPIKPKLVGKMLTGLKDVNGKLFFTEFINVANEQGSGWVDYMWPKPGEKKPSPKLTYVYKVPGQSIILAAGIYE